MERVIKSHSFALLLIAAVCVLFTSCGAGTSVKENAVLGKVPGLYMESSQLRKDFREWARDQRDVQKIHDKEIDLKAKQRKLAEEATEAAQKLIGTNVPFASGDVDPNFNIVNIIIEEYNDKGCFTARAFVQAKREMQVVQFPSQVTDAMQLPLVDTYLYYVLLTPDNTGIALGKINPFSDRPALGVSGSNVFELNAGDVVQAGENLTQMGSPIALNCEMYDMTNFATIKFISVQDYHNLGGR